MPAAASDGMAQPSSEGPDAGAQDLNDPQGPDPAEQQQEEVEISPSHPISSVYVSFKGLKRVSPHSLIGECRALGSARTVGDIQQALDHAQGRLTELGLLKTLRTEVSLDEKDAVNVVFFTEEKGRECTVSGNVDKKGEVSCDLRLIQPALLGGALSAMGSIGSTASQAREFLLRLSTPRFLGRRLAWSLDAARSSSDEREASSYSERVTHAVMKISDCEGAHSVFAEAALRDILPATDGLRLPSVEVLQAQLKSVKTSLMYTYSWTGMAPSMALVRGASASLHGNLEAAGLLGDVHFLRSEAHASACWRMPWHLLWHMSGSWGVLLPLNGQPTCLQDRFFIGGASGSSTVFKGFAHRGVGPVGFCEVRDPEKPAKRLTDALGGDAMLNTYTAISAPVPIPFTTGGGSVEGRAFAFVGLGALCQKPCTGTRALLEGLHTGARASAGVGLAVPLAGLGSLELSFAHPFWAQCHDIRQRWQLGLRLNLRS